MEDIIKVLEFCKENKCTPSTIVFESGRIYNTLTEVVYHWEEPHKSFQNADVSANLHLEGIKNAFNGINENTVNWSSFCSERSVYNSIITLIKSAEKKQIELPSVTIESFRVSCEISETNLQEVFVKVEDYICAYKGMKKIPTTFTDKLPDWMAKDSNKYIIIKVRGTDIKISEKLITFTAEDEIYANHMMNDVCLEFDLHVIGYDINNIKTNCGVKTTFPWKSYIFSDIITNEKSISQITSIQEQTKILHEKKYINCVLMDSKFTIIDDIPTDLKIRVSMSKCYANSLLVSYVATLLLSIYDDLYDTVNSIYSCVINEEPNNIIDSEKPMKILREAEPDLFINNYSRECPKLPILITEEEARTYNIKCLEYHGKYYTAPPGFYVGLKVNRLHNNDKYPYLVTVYKTDHSTNKNKPTYKYINKIETSPTLNIYTKTTKKVSNILGAHTDIRYKSSSFAQCVTEALGESTGETYVDICRQELWYLTDIINIDTDLCYRLFEEAYNCNILMLSIVSGEYNILIPPHKDRYMWSRQNSTKGIIIIKTSPPNYTIKKATYELVANTMSNSYIFNTTENNICSRLLMEKQNITINEILPNLEDISSQYINQNGKCVTVRNDKSEERCYCRPFNLPVFEKRIGVIRQHLNTMNIIRYNTGIPTISWLSSNNKYLYFPDSESYNVWHLDQ